MSAVEHKHPGYCVNSRGELREIKRVDGDDDDDDGWECDTMLLTEENFSYALGAQGSTRRKLATAAGCILEYVGRVACMAGYKKERRRAREYLTWLIDQRRGPVAVPDARDRDDCTVMKARASSRDRARKRQTTTRGG